MVYLCYFCLCAVILRTVIIEQLCVKPSCVVSLLPLQCFSLFGATGLKHLFVLSAPVPSFKSVLLLSVLFLRQPFCFDPLWYCLFPLLLFLTPINPPLVLLTPALEFVSFMSQHVAMFTLSLSKFRHFIPDQPFLHQNWNIKQTAKNSIMLIYRCACNCHMGKTAIVSWVEIKPGQYLIFHTIILTTHCTTALSIFQSYFEILVIKFSGLRGSLVLLK